MSNLVGLHPIDLSGMQRTIDRHEATIADLKDAVASLAKRLQQLERDAMRRGSQIVTMRPVERA